MTIAEGSADPGRAPNNRFDGGSDAELIQLFKRNKQVLNRSDEDVIAAMVHPR
jgi:hypothetical protein